MAAAGTGMGAGVEGAAAPSALAKDWAVAISASVSAMYAIAAPTGAVSPAGTMIWARYPS